MRVLAIGDPHGKIKKIPKNVDAILLTGDVGKADLAREIAFRQIREPDYEPSNFAIKKSHLEIYDSTLRLLRSLPKKVPVYFIYGNVEEKDSDTKKRAKQIGMKLPLLGKAISKIKNVHIINNKRINLEGLVIVGGEYFVETGWVKRFTPDNEENMEIARKKTKQSRKFYSKLGKADILLCHQPPYRILDKVSFKGAPKSWKGKHAGSEIILSYIKRKQPKYVFCGHIHEGEGMKKIGKTEIYNLGVRGYKIIEL